MDVETHNRLGNSALLMWIIVVLMDRSWKNMVTIVLARGLWFIVIPVIIYKLARKVRSHYWVSHSVKLESDLPLDDATTIGESFFKIVKDMSSVDFYKFKFYEVKLDDKQPSDVSNGASRFRKLIADSPLTRVDSAFEMGVGRGGWTQVAREHVKGDYTGISRWNQPGQEERWIDMHGVDYVSTDARHVIPRYVDLFMSDMGESDRMGSYAEQVDQTMTVLRNVRGWLLSKPRYFYVRIPNPLNEDVLCELEGIKSKLKTGKFVRLESERNSVPTVYFTHGEGDLRNQVRALANILLSRASNEESWPDCTSDNNRVRQAHWQETPPLPVPTLEPMDMKRCYLKGLRPPENRSDFMKEIGWVPCDFKGRKGTLYNSVVFELVKPLSGLLNGFGFWQTTSTTPSATFATVQRKIDVSPKENHGEYERLWGCYKAISRYLRKRGHRLRRLKEAEVINSVNKHGSLGRHDADLKFANLGELALKPEVWRPRVNQIRAANLAEKPKWVDFESIGKKERKSKDSSRLIWYMSGCARLYEAELFGHYDSILKALPQSVSGIPLYDYGDTIAALMGEDMCAVCDDVAAWDTRISVGIQSLECAYMCSLTDDEQLRREITQMYRLYAYPLVSITRPNKKQVQMVQYRIKGQVASGRRITYGMNTTTNICVTASRAAYSYGISQEDTEEWFYGVLEKGGHTNEYGGKISGDDSVIIMDVEHAELFAKKGADFMNRIGLKRKDVPEYMPSSILNRMEDVEFCSHNYTLITFSDGDKKHKKWMPVRSVTEIIAKACIMTTYMMPEGRAAWARAQALNLIVNYFHIPTVRLLALAVLSCTPNNIDLSCTMKGWKYRATPWIRQDNVINIINGCLFGDSSTYPVDFRIQTTKGLGYMTRRDRAMYDVKWSSIVYLRWKNGLEWKAMMIRTGGARNWKYDNWLPREIYDRKKEMSEERLSSVTRNFML